MVNFSPLTVEMVRYFGTPQLISTGFRVLAALLHGVGVRAKLCGVEQRVRPIFGRTAITLVIGPHSSFIIKLHYERSIFNNATVSLIIPKILTILQKSLLQLSSPPIIYSLELYSNLNKP